MLSSVLHGRRAAQVNIAIMRAFVKLRQFLAEHHDIAKRLDAIELRVLEQETSLREHSRQVREVFRAIRRLMQPRREPEREIGFKPD